MTPRTRVCLASGICLAGLATTLGSQRPGAAQARSYVVQPGDSLSAIAARAHRSQAELARLNGIANPDHLQAGQVLTVPDGPGGDTFEPGRTGYQASDASYRSGSAYQPATSATQLTQQVPAQSVSEGYRAGAAVAAIPGMGGSYMVRPGDTLGALSNRFGVPLATLASTNGIRRLEFLQIGQQLTIPSRAATIGVASGTAMGSVTGTRAGAGAAGDQSAAVSTPVAAVPAVALATGGTSGAGIAAVSASGGGVGALLTAEAQAYRIDPALVKAVAWQESGWRMVVAADGGIGVMQLMPATAAWVGPALLGRAIDHTTSRTMSRRAWRYWHRICRRTAATCSRR